VSGSGLATSLAVAAGLAGSVLVTAVLAFVLVHATRRSAAGYERALHQPWWMLAAGAVLSLRK
jgi:hypothetical protein